jgi:dephospho-CoA kinase
MLFVGLTGGIGSGKSTVASMFARRGAVVIDADDLARRATLPGTAGHARVAERFGAEVLTPSGAIDRGRLAQRVFADERERRDLEAIVHPEVARLLAEALEEHRGTDHIVVYDVPLLFEAGLQSMFDVIVVVSAPERARIERLAAQRGMNADEVRARIAAQSPDAKRERAADVVIRNTGTMSELEAETDAAWELLTRRAKL